MQEIMHWTNIHLNYININVFFLKKLSELIYDKDFWRNQSGNYMTIYRMTDYTLAIMQKGDKKKKQWSTEHYTEN